MSPVVDINDALESDNEDNISACVEENVDTTIDEDKTNKMYVSCNLLDLNCEKTPWMYS